MDVQHQEMIVDRGSIAGYVAATDSEINIPNAYDIDSSAPYSFNSEIDRSMGYRTVSILAFPLRNYRGEVIGVLQFINRKSRRDAILDSTVVTLAETIPFEEGQINILRALASQSAVAIENNVLLEEINNLFSSFVQASVAAVEQRDPTTSGHSFRVADLCTELAIKLSQANLPDYRGVRFKEAELKELRYAALLHDFGKLGVREQVLTKANKLPAGNFELIRYRIRLTQESLRRQMYEQMLRAVKEGADSRQLAALEQAAATELDRLDKYLLAIEQANIPTVREQGFFDHLAQVKAYPFQAPDEEMQFLLSDQEYECLSIRRGSLSQAERAEIESHVVHTANFLRLIPWTPELARIPALAEAHHEKLDGTGYPYGKLANEIPVGSKIMAITDIYDALTASDRPYKSAVPRDIAYNILCDEAAEGKLDAWLVQLFIDAEVYRVLDGKDYRAATVKAGDTSNHPCDPELHTH
jgi:HD-GYP domain-containing protein (c-di-GMP phosphodiesterase class II)